MARVLASVEGLAEAGAEIVALDSGSTDGTIELLEKAGARVIETQWKGHIATKQLALEACTRTWVLHLDSDEPLEPDLEAAIGDLIERDDDTIAGARVNRKIWYQGRLLNHVWQPEWRLRLVRKRDVVSGKARWGGMDPHDQLMVDPEAGRIVDLPGTLRHESFESFAEHLVSQLNLSRIAAQSMHRAGRRGSRSRLFISPPGAFIKQIILKQGWRDGRAGWLAAGSAAAGALMKHMILLELESRDDTRSSESSPDDATS